MKQKGQATSDAGPVWSLSGNQGDRWKQAKISIHPTSSFQVTHWLMISMMSRLIYITHNSSGRFPGCSCGNFLYRFIKCTGSLKQISKRRVWTHMNTKYSGSRHSFSVWLLSKCQSDPLPFRSVTETFCDFWSSGALLQKQPDSQTAES